MAENGFLIITVQVPPLGETVHTNFPPKISPQGPHGD